jgi:uncharacterized SAM-binding protein YcdF (DUF218 family)
LRKVLVVVEVLLVVLLAASLYLFIFVPSAHPTRADAIVVLSSDRPRYDLGLRLFRQNVAPTLLVSLPGFPGGGDTCPKRATCFRAKPYSTRGEAETVARFARAHGWHTLVVVTSRYHERRAYALFHRCTNVKLEFVPASAPVQAYLRNIPLEWAKLSYQLTMQRTC